MYLSLNQLGILIKISKAPPSMLTYFEVSINFHVWRNLNCFILVLLPCILTGAQYRSRISFHCHPRNSFCFSPVVEFLFLHPISSSSLIYLLILKEFTSNNVLRKDAEVELLSWKCFSFRILMTLLHCLLISSIFVEMSQATLISDPLNGLSFS